MPKVLGAGTNATEPTSYCPVGACTAQVPERLLVCRGHAADVPAALIDTYRSTYRRGQNALTASPANRAAYAAITAHCSQPPGGTK